MHTFSDSDGSIRPERATAIICKELDKAAIDICALSESVVLDPEILWRKVIQLFGAGVTRKELVWVSQSAMSLTLIRFRLTIESLHYE